MTRHPRHWRHCDSVDGRDNSPCATSAMISPHADPRHRYRARGLLPPAVLDTECGRADRAGIAGDEARPCRSADAADRARHEGSRASPFAALDRIAVTTGPGSFTGLRVGISAARGIALAADKPVVGLTTLSAYAAPLRRRERRASDHRRDRCAARPCLFPGGRAATARTLVRPRVAPIAEALRCGAVRRAALWSAMPRKFSPSAGRRKRCRRFKVDAQPAPDIAWVAWLGAAVRSGHRAGPSRFICARPMPSRKAICCRQPAQFAAP